MQNRQLGTRRSWIVIALACVASLGAAGHEFAAADELNPNGRTTQVESPLGGELHSNDVPHDLDIIDCHTHFYDPSRPEGVPWPSEDSTLYRTVLPRHFLALNQFRPVTGTIIVEASSRLEDNDWLLKLSEPSPFVLGIVGRLEPGNPDFANHVKRFAANPLFRGIRVNVVVLKRQLDANELADFELLAKHDLALDVNGGPDTPAAVAKLAEKVPGLRIVLNHIGNVAVTSAAPPEAWQAGITAAAGHPKVFCKVSALVESAAHHSGEAAPEDLAFYRPYFDVVWDAFGEDRVIYASNWPVSERGASYETLQRLAFQYAAERGDEAIRKFASLNSKRAYQWTERPGRRNESSGQ